MVFHPDGTVGMGDARLHWRLFLRRAGDICDHGDCGRARCGAHRQPLQPQLGPGTMGTAIIRRVAAGKMILLGDISKNALERVAP